MGKILFETGWALFCIAFCFPAPILLMGKIPLALWLFLTWSCVFTFCRLIDNSDEP